MVSWFFSEPNHNGICGFRRVLIFIALTIKARKNPLWADAVIDFVDVLFKQERIRTILLGVFIIVLLGGIFFIFSTYARLDYTFPAPLLATFELIRTYISCLVPYVLWGMLLSIQSLVFLSILGYGSRTDYYRVVRLISLLFSRSY